MNNSLDSESTEKKAASVFLFRDKMHKLNFVKTESDVLVLLWKDIIIHVEEDRRETLELNTAAAKHNNNNMMYL